ncbi:TonB-dependent receptor [Endozoicomonas sp. OPT23]|uniref:TonB-dependent receptor n=1 Tax=Endozoicomonas sp. OPT23 TaxID=2072845 RepID=UPI00129A14A2|nr:TonB-dependent receptor [Endozoicomonas sp. OPT23]MRI34972.1 TonB-dependent receptor [Endozoicomonas sp. OPT23]
MLKPLARTPLAMAVAVALSAGYAYAETGALEEVIVTAQKREQDMQDTPISVAAFGAEAIEDQGINDISDISQFTPNVEIVESPGGTTGATIAIRGSTTINPAVTWEPTVGIYVDGVFIAKNVGGLFDVAELERIEILRGPQGTLYGKNTIGGAVNLITRKPGDEFGGTVRLGAGNFGNKEGFISLDTGRVGDIGSFNIAANIRKRDGLYDNISTNPQAADTFKKLDTSALRLAGLLDINDRLEAYYTYDQSEKDNTPSMAQRETLSSKPERKDEAAVNGAIKDTSKSFGHALTLTYDLSETVTVKSITSYRNMKFNDSADYDGTDLAPGTFHASRDVESDQTSQEFQLIGSTDSMDYVLGLYYFTEDSKAINPYEANFGSAIAVDNKYGVESTSYAVYGQTDYYLADQWTLTGGVRWTKENKEAYLERTDPTGGAFGGNVPKTTVDKNWKNISPMATISYAVSDDISTYFKIAQGWKAGGWNPEGATKALFEEGYEEEKVTSYELGVKSRLLDNRLQLNASIFQNDVSDLQLAHFTGTVTKAYNAGNAIIKGFELEAIAALTDEFTLNFNYGYLNTKYGKLLVEGIEQQSNYKFPYSPKSKYSIGLDYYKPVSLGAIKARLDYSWVDSQFLYPEPVAANLTKVDAYSLINARVALTDIAVGENETMEVALWGKNLTNEEYRINGIPNTNFGFATNYYGDPRTYGVDATYRF